MDRIASMKVFVRAAELGSFAAVADALGMSGPMVGKHVQALEQALGARLINRTTRRQSLTETGQACYERCKAVLAEVETLHALASEASMPRGKLRIGMPVHFGRHCAAPVLIGLSQRYPQLELELSFNDGLVDLADERLDMVIRTGLLEHRADHIARRIARQRMVVCGSPSYLASHGEPLSLEELAKHRAVLYGRAGRAAPWLFPVANGEVRRLTMPAQILLDDLDAIADAAAQGLGLAWLPLWLAAGRLKQGSLVRVLDREGEYLYDCHAVWLASPFMPAKLRLAIDTLATELPGRIA